MTICAVQYVTAIAFATIQVRRERRRRCGTSMAIPIAASTRCPIPETNCVSVASGICAWKRIRISVASAMLPRPKYRRTIVNGGATTRRTGAVRGMTETATVPITRPVVITVLELMKRYGFPRTKASRPARSFAVGMSDA